jgi:hypothetical protein
MGLRKNKKSNLIFLGKNLNPANSEKLQELDIRCCCLQLCVYRNLTFGKITYGEVHILRFLYKLAERQFLHQFFCRYKQNNSKTFEQILTTFNFGYLHENMSNFRSFVPKYDNLNDHFT